MPAAAARQSARHSHAAAIASVTATATPLLQKGLRTQLCDSPLFQYNSLDFYIRFRRNRFTSSCRRLDWCDNFTLVAALFWA